MRQEEEHRLHRPSRVPRECSGDVNGDTAPCLRQEGWEEMTPGISLITLSHRSHTQPAGKGLPAVLESTSPHMFPAFQAVSSDCPSHLFTHSLTHKHAPTATPIPNLNNFLFSMGQMAKNLPATVGDPGLIPWAGKTPWRREVATPLQYSGLENPTDRGAWWGYSTWDRRVGKD